MNESINALLPCSHSIARECLQLELQGTGPILYDGPFRNVNLPSCKESDPYQWFDWVHVFAHGVILPLRNRR